SASRSAGSSAEPTLSLVCSIDATAALPADRCMARSGCPTGAALSWVATTAASGAAVSSSWVSAIRPLRSTSSHGVYGARRSVDSAVGSVGDGGHDAESHLGDVRRHVPGVVDRRALDEEVPRVEARQRVELL